MDKENLSNSGISEMIFTLQNKTVKITISLQPRTLCRSLFNNHTYH